jgi:hypothetical protein
VAAERAGRGPEGRELDERVAREVLGFDTEQRQWHTDWQSLPLGQTGYTRRCRRCGSMEKTWPPTMLTGPCRLNIPPFSSQIDAAYLVLDAIWAMDVTVRHRFYAWIKEEMMHDRIGGWFSRRDEHPVLICRAALAALGATGEGAEGKP